MEKIQFLGKSKFLNKWERSVYRQLLESISKDHNYVISSLTYVFMSDDELLEINQQSLNHDDYTDIITFDLSDKEGSIDGEIYISKDRIKENAEIYNTNYNDELTRVISHGLLHLMGYKDKKESDTLIMRNAENKSIETWKHMFHMKPNQK